MIASSAKQGPVLIHTITGELLRRLAPPSESLRKWFKNLFYDWSRFSTSFDQSESESLKSARHIIFSNDGFLLACYGDRHLVNYTVNGSKVHDIQGKCWKKSLLFVRFEPGIFKISANKFVICRIWTRIYRFRRKNIVFDKFEPGIFWFKHKKFVIWQIWTRDLLIQTKKFVFWQIWTWDLPILRKKDCYLSDSNLGSLDFNTFESWWWCKYINTINRW